MRTLFQIHAKPPRAGTAKTRLGARIGHDRAAAFAQAFLVDTLALLRRVEGARVVLVSPEPAEDHGVDAEVWDQGGGDLGQKLERAYRRGLGVADVVIAIGADSPGLPFPHVEALVALANVHPSVLCPAEDGGFWALALRACPEGLLADLPWSQPTTAAATALRLPGVVHGPRWWDVDELADLERVRTLVPPGDAPATHALLRDLR